MGLGFNTISELSKGSHSRFPRYFIQRPTSNASDDEGASLTAETLKKQKYRPRARRRPRAVNALGEAYARTITTRAPRQLISDISMFDNKSLSKTIMYFYISYRVCRTSPGSMAFKDR